MKYVVYLTTYTGKLLPPFYIGSTSIEKAKSGNYFGSVSSVKWKTIFEKELKENPGLFSIEILSIYEDRASAFIEECKLQREHNVIESEEYFNEAIVGPTLKWAFANTNTIDQRLRSAQRMRMMNRKEIPGKSLGNNKSGKYQDNRGQKNPMFGKARKKQICTNCGAIVDIANLKRWHNGKCKKFS